MPSTKLKENGLGSMLPYAFSSLRAFPGLAISSLVCLLAGSGLALTGPLVVRRVIDDGISAGDVSRTMLLSLIFLSVEAARTGAEAGQGYLLRRLSHRTTSRLRGELFRHLQRLPLSWFDTTPAGEAVTRLTGDVAALGDAISSGMVGLFRDALVLIGVGVLTVWLHPRFGASVLACTLAVGIPAILIRRSAQERAASALTAISKMNGVLEENIAGQGIIRLFGAESLRGEFFRKESQSALGITLSTLRTRVFFDAAASLTSAVALTTIIGLGGRELTRGSLSQGLLVAFVQYGSFLMGSMRGAAEKGVSLLSGLSAGERVVGILGIEPALSAPRESVDPPVKTSGLSLSGVTFGYGPERDVLRGISVHVPAGQRVALIGRTGAGKTTLARLLARFYDPREGTIRLGGVDLRNLPLQHLRRRVSFVTQTVAMFQDSVLENVRLGRPRISREAVVEACRAVRAHDFIEKLPGGYDALLGATGRDLSLGERQLLSFARVLVGEPELLILDEPTANVDPRSEDLILLALESILSGRTSLIIAHRHSTLRGADRVLLMEEGRIVADGPWSEVLPTSERRVPAFDARSPVVQDRPDGSVNHGK